MGNTFMRAMVWDSKRRFFTTFLIALFMLVKICAAQAPGALNPYKPLVDRLESIVGLPLADWRYHADVAHPEDSSLDDKEWPVVKTGEAWKTGPRVLRRRIEVPATLNGYSLRGARIRLALAVDSNDFVTVTVFSNGAMVSRTDADTLQPIVLTENAQPGDTFLVAIRIQAAENNTKISGSRLLITPPANRPDPGIFTQEILAAQPMVAAFPEGRAEHEAMLDAAVKSVGLNALEQGDQAAFDESLRKAQEKLQALTPWLRQFTIRADGNSHIDMAWLWPWTETVEVVRNTFRSALDLMREYPDFKFTMSSARTYSWMEEKYPDLFKEIQERVKEGRWEIVGGMWVEPDLNMPGGESLVRQVLVGKRYFQQKFGVDVNIGWNPDSFGYNWQLPQIYKKSGFDYFVTQKMSWNETTVFPYKVVWWQAPDSSRVLTFFPHDYDNPHTPNSGIDPAGIANDVAHYVPETNFPEIMHLYGVGDHGGGPTRAMLDDILALEQPSVAFPRFTFS